MLVYFYFVIPLVIGIIIWLRFQRKTKQGVLDGLLADAIKSENNGLYEDAITKYKIALVEMNKSKYDQALKLKTSEKIKLLHIVVEYEKNSVAPPRLPPEIKPDR
jgi:hypothetical protein